MLNGPGVSARPMTLRDLTSGELKARLQICLAPLEATLVPSGFARRPRSLRFERRFREGRQVIWADAARPPSSQSAIRLGLWVDLIYPEINSMRERLLVGSRFSNKASFTVRAQLGSMLPMESWLAESEVELCTLVDRGTAALQAQILPTLDALDSVEAIGRHASMTNRVAMSTQWHIAAACALVLAGDLGAAIAFLETRLAHSSLAAGFYEPMIANIRAVND